MNNVDETLAPGDSIENLFGFAQNSQKLELSNDQLPEEIEFEKFDPY